MRIEKVSRSYGRKISINYQGYDFNAIITALPEKQDMTEQELQEFGNKVYNAAKQMVLADIDAFYREQNKESTETESYK